MNKYKYYNYIRNMLSYHSLIIPRTYYERKYTITFCELTIDGEIYHYFIDTFNKSATTQKLSIISVNNPIGCTSDFIELFKIIDDEEEEQHHKYASRGELYSHILKRFNRLT